MWRVSSQSEKVTALRSRSGLREQMDADVDFLQEIDNPNKLVFKLVRPLHIEEPPGPDVAFFEIEMVSGDARLAKRIDLATTIGATAGMSRRSAIRHTTAASPSLT